MGVVTLAVGGEGERWVGGVGWGGVEWSGAVVGGAGCVGERGVEWGS